MNAPRRPSRWMIVVVIAVALLSAFAWGQQKGGTTAPEPMVWDTRVLASSDGDFDENRKALLIAGWEPFSTSSYNLGSSNLTWYYYLHLRKRVPASTLRPSEVKSRTLTGSEAEVAMKPFLGEWIGDLPSIGTIEVSISRQGDQVSMTIHMGTFVNSDPALLRVYRNDNGTVFLGTSPKDKRPVNISDGVLVLTNSTSDGDGSLKLRRKAP